MAKIDKKPQAEAVMYIGPSKPGLLHVQFGSVFRFGVLPLHLVEASKGKTGEPFKQLFIPVSQAGAALAALKDTTTNLAQAYKAVAAMEG